MMPKNKQTLKRLFVFIRKLFVANYPPPFKEV